jgi:hypothetical protein
VPVEIDETRLGNLTTIAQIADGLLKHPAARKKYLEAVKETFPTMAIPEIDAAAPIVGEVAKIREEFTGELKKFREDMEKANNEALINSVKNRFAGERDKLIKQHNYTTEGADALIKMMEEKRLTDFDDARKIFEFDNPRPPPGRPTRGNMFDMQEQQKNGDDYIKSLFAAGRDSGAHESLIDGKIASVLSEARQGLGQMTLR